MDELDSRASAAAALRRLGHAFVSHDLDEQELARIEAAADELAATAIAAPARVRPIEHLKWAAFQVPERDGALLSHFRDCIVSGRDNPMGIGIVARREGLEAVTTVRLGAAFEGAPGRAHGGVVSAIFDDTMGYVINMLGRPAYTAWLTVTYLAPTPMGVDIEFRARVRSEEGRKLFLEAEADHNGARIATAEALFIAIPPERLGLPTRTPSHPSQGS